MEQRQPDSHVVFTNGRSGSNFIVDALNQHPSICNYGEVLGVYMPTMKLHDRFGYGGGTAEAYLDHILTSRRHFELAQVYSAAARLRRRQPLRQKRWSALVSVGIKDFSIRFAERDVTGYLSERPDIKVVSLHRENSLRRVISLISMAQTGIVRVDASSRGSQGSHQQFEIDIDEVVRELKVFEEEKLQQLAIVDGLDPERCYRVTYEGLFASPEASRRIVDEIYEFLGAKAHSMTMNHQRILPTDLRATVFNYAEMEEVVVRHGFGHYLEDA